MSLSLSWLHWRPPPGLRFDVDDAGFIRLVKARSPRDNPDNYLGTDRRGWQHWLRLPLSALRQARGRSAGSGTPRFLPLLAYDTDLPRRVRRQIHLVERRIATLPHEVVWVFTPAGQVLNPGGFTEHREDRVRMPQALGGLMAGNIVTHNHPGATPLSIEDVQTAIRHNLREVRAVGVDRPGVAWTYRMQRPASGAWPAA